MRLTEAEFQAILKRPWRAQGRSRATPAKAKLGEGVQAFQRLQRRSRLELALLAQIEEARLPTPECEYRPIPTRRWRLDFVWLPAFRGAPFLGVEVQGSVHRIKGKHARDIEKRAELMLAGWRVLEVDGDSIRDGRAIAWIKRLLY